MTNKSDHSESDSDTEHESDSGGSDDGHGNGFLKVDTRMNQSGKFFNLHFPKSRQSRVSHNSMKKIRIQN